MSATDLVILVTAGAGLAFAAAAVLMLGWALRGGQFDNFQQGARSIFGPDEPIGEPTDSFPGEPRA